MTNDQGQITSLQKKELTDYNILKTIENNSSVSQRGLSSQMEINVASVNFALKRLIKKGFVRMVGINSKRIKYHITPKGFKAKTKMAYTFFGKNIHFYREVRNDIETQIREFNSDSKGKVAIYGVVGLAEIAYMAVVSMRLEFAGFFTDDLEKTNEIIFGHQVQKLETLKEMQPCLLLLTDEFPVDMMCDIDIKNVDTLNLLNYY